MNKITIIGNLTRDPESSQTQAGVSFCRFSVAVNRPYTDSSGDRPCDFFEVITWRSLAERCGKYLFKSSKVGVSGEMQQRKFTDRDGNERTAWELVGNEVEFLSPRNGGSQHDLKPADNEDLPF